MDLVLHERGEGGIDQSMPLDAGDPRESGRNDGQLVVATAGRCAGVADVAR